MSNLHGSSMIFGRTGLLIRGQSGAGKSRLVALLLNHAAQNRRFARLVADDRVLVSRAGDRLIGRPPTQIAGLLEVRGTGIIAVDYEPAAVLRLVVDLLPTAEVERMLEKADATTHILGVALPRMVASNVESAAEKLYLAFNMILNTKCSALPLAFAAQHGKYAPSFDRFIALPES